MALDIRFFWAAFIGYGAAFLFSILALAISKNAARKSAVALSSISFLLLTIAVVARTVHIHRLPLSNMFEFLYTFTWFCGVFYALAYYKYRWPALTVAMNAVIFMLLAAGSLLPKEPEMQLMPALQSYWLQIHVTMAALGEAAFAVAFAANILYVGARLWPSLSSRLPRGEALDVAAYKAVTIGYPLFTIGALFAGAIWAEQAWGRFWSWDPKEVGSLVVWLIYSGYLHVRLVKGWTGMPATIISMAGFVCTLLTFFANLLLGGLHAYN